MTELRPWAGFDSLADGLVLLHARAREAAVRSVDEILTLRNWLIGAWIVAYKQEGADRARCGAAAHGARHPLPPQIAYRDFDAHALAAARIAPAVASLRPDAPLGATMPTPVHDLEAEVLGLPPEDRARLLERLIASFEPRSSAQRAWLEVALRRQAEVEAGKVAMVPGDEALARVRSRIA